MRTIAILAVVLTLGCAGSPPGDPTPLRTHPRNEARYVTMRDSVRIAIDVWLPGDLASGMQIPTVMRATRYWRATDQTSDRLEDDKNYDEAQRFIGNG
jgi:predicted acyl esterase